MHHFQHINKRLVCENVDISLLSSEVQTPFYLYSHEAVKSHFSRFDSAFSMPNVSCFSVKACSNLAILNIIASCGGGADIVSGGELYRALLAGIPANKIVFSGVGKTKREIKYALSEGILLFNIESQAELLSISEVACDMGKIARVAIRVNPNIDAETHPYIATGLKESKFGISYKDIHKIFALAKDKQGIDVVGIDCHIGSQLTSLRPIEECVSFVRDLASGLQRNGFNIEYIDLGGGLGIDYNGETLPSLSEYGSVIMKGLEGLKCTLILEPGRVITGNAGVLVTKVLYTKCNENKKFVIVDAGMNDLLRPSLYDAYHEVVPVIISDIECEEVDIVGPICESGDFIAHNRSIPKVEQGDLLAVKSAGAYGFSMASNYNSRPRVAEVLVKDGKFCIIRTPESYESLVSGEIIPDEDF